MELFRAVRLANPSHVKQLAQVGGIDLLREEVQSLRVLKHVDDATIQGLLAALPAYMVTASPYAGDWVFHPPSVWANVEEGKSFKKHFHQPLGLEILSFWDTYGHDGLQRWAKLVEEIFTFAPSSAAVERVFSFLRYKFDKGTHGALIDYIAAAIMLRANGRVVEK